MDDKEADGLALGLVARGVKGRITDMDDYDVDDASTVAVTFESGAVANLMSSCASRAGGGVHMTVVGMHHYATFTGWDNSVVIRKSALEEERIQGESNIFEIEDAAFIAAVTTANPGSILSDYADGCRSLAFCLAANRSLETGQVVSLASL